MTRCDTYLRVRPTPAWMDSSAALLQCVHVLSGHLTAWQRTAVTSARYWAALLHAQCLWHRQDHHPSTAAASNHCLGHCRWEYPISNRYRAWYPVSRPSSFGHIVTWNWNAPDNNGCCTKMYQNFPWKTPNEHDLMRRVIWKRRQWATFQRWEAGWRVGLQLSTSASVFRVCVSSVLDRYTYFSQRGFSCTDRPNNDEALIVFECQWEILECGFLGSEAMHLSIL